ncbi:MAG: ankyrin repeat domain-containing protein [Gammaproteobacteria bacterium]|nr:ankyrin repeat domain-containing protein [Gammaproteobacteria bacterium]
MTKTSILTGKASDFLKIGVGAAGRGDLDTLKQVLSECPEWRTRIGSHGRTMLWEASFRGRLNVVSHLLDTYDDIDIEARGCHYTPLLVEISPLCAAIFKKRASVVSRLEDAGARRDVLTSTFLGEIDIVRELISDKPSLVNEEFYQHDPHFNATLLHYAVSGVHQNIVELLIDQGAKIRPHSDLLLRFALWRGNAEILRLLLEAGLDVTQKTLLQGDVGDTRVIEMLKSFGAKIEIDASQNGWPSLVYICRGDRGGNPKIVHDLLDQGADVNVTNYKGQTALHCAAKAGFVEPVRILLAHGANVNAQDRDGDTPLHCACRSSIKNHENLQQVIDLLIENGASLLVENRQGRTPKQVLRRSANLVL